jgi:ubiquinone/menaquinone biosynthesis C-methylase UbiE
MNEDIARQVFFELHSDLPREGPGNDEVTTQAWSLLPPLPEHPQILDLGCGPGMQTVQLARLSQGTITAVDLHQPFLEQLAQRAEASGLSDRITPLKADMGNLPLPPASIDVIWAEGSAYILGFVNALRQWRSLLKRPGYLCVSELCWIRPNPPAAAVEFWQTEYPGMETLEANLALIKTAGYLPLAHFLLPNSAWWEHYYTPLEGRLNTLVAHHANNPTAMAVLDSHRHEIEICRQYSDYYSYVFFILQGED